MIFQAFFAALGQMSDPRFMRVLWRGVGLSLGLLIAIGLALGILVEMILPGSVSLPFIGTVGGLGIAAAIGVAVAMLVASVFLMVPVAAAFSAIFLDEVADAVEASHYPGQVGKPLPLAEGIADSALLFAVMVAVNLVALALSFVLGPLGPMLFWAVNGWLLGREYFLMAARRHLPRDQAVALASRHRGKLWIAGTLMAAPLSLPLVSLFIPVLGAATFTHLFQGLRNS
ncbi:EI24 domain-containing protein [Stagnihabitans tardus]|uniref:EI24 domain-containing protein n=1 Tax=Stagnihabitans tardus TaxID=2699202 RepID=UPI00338DDAEC